MQLLRFVQHSKIYSVAKHSQIYSIPLKLNKYEHFSLQYCLKHKTHSFLNFIEKRTQHNNE